MEIEKLESENPNIIVISTLWGLFVLLILEQLSQLKSILDQMSTTGEVFPLQRFLTYFQSVWDIVDRFFELFLTKGGYQLFLVDYAWGGFTFATVIWTIIYFLNNKNSFNTQFDADEKVGLQLSYLFVLFFVLTIIHQIHADNWVPYVQEPTWVINVKHKQQISAGTFLIIYWILLGMCHFTNMRGHENALNFIKNKKLNFYVFIMMNLDNLASFSDFPWFLDPSNQYIDGYEEIFQEGQTLTSSDKIYHFTMSSVAAVILLSFIPNLKKSVAIAIAVVVFWELFEISLNPKESSDSGLDMIINSSAIILTSVLFQKYSKLDLDQPKI